MLRHLLENNLEKILERSLINCHASGLHSVMLIEKPEQTVRLFITDTVHDLWKNHPDNFHLGMSVGFHKHHCNVTLIAVHGLFYNWLVAPLGEQTSDSPGAMKLDVYQYQSGITNQEITFKKLGVYYFQTISNHCYSASKEVSCYESVYMKACVRHSVYVPKGSIAAWVVVEGKENPCHDDLCFSNVDLEKEDFSHLYQPMTEKGLFNLLKAAELL